MKVYKDVIVPEKVIPEKKIEEHWAREYVSTNCDICKEPITDGGGYDADEVEIQMKQGYQYPEGGSGTYTSFDVCCKCFKEKLMPWFKSEFGSVPTVTEWNW